MTGRQDTLKCLEIHPQISSSPEMTYAPMTPLKPYSYTPKLIAPQKLQIQQLTRHEPP